MPTTLSGEPSQTGYIEYLLWQMVFSHSSSESSIQSMVRSVRCVTISAAVRSSNSKTFWMKSCSSLSMAPVSPPVSTIILISSSLTRSSLSLGSIPKSLRTALVETERSHTTGLNKTDIPLTIPDTPRASCSDLFMAIRLGTSSPKIRVKYERMRVMMITAIVSRVLLGRVTPRLTTQSTSGSEKLSAAKALPRNPESVMAIWMVERNFAGSRVSL